MAGEEIGRIRGFNKKDKKILKPYSQFNRCVRGGGANRDWLTLSAIAGFQEQPIIDQLTIVPGYRKQRAFDRWIDPAGRLNI